MQEQQALNGLVSPDEESASDILGKFSTSPGSSEEVLWDIFMRHFILPALLLPCVPLDFWPALLSAVRAAACSCSHLSERGEVGGEEGGEAGN